MIGNASSAQADRAQDTLPSLPPMMAAKTAALEPVSPMPAQVEAALPPPAQIEPVVPATDAKAPEFASALSLFATLAVVPPILGRASAYTDPTQDALLSVSPVMATKPATLELTAPVPLPKPKPHVTVVQAGRAVPLPLPRPRPVGSNPPRLGLDGRP